MPRRKLSDMRIVRVPSVEEETNSDDLTSVGSSKAPDTVENVEIEDENGRRHKTRGQTTLKELYQLPPGEYVKVSKNDVGQPIGVEAGVLAGYLDIVACNATLLPINYNSWREMPNSNKNQAVDYVKEKFSLEVSDDYLKMALRKKWRDYKSFLKKKYFKNNLSLEEKLRNVPTGVHKHQWEDAVRFWSSNKREARERVRVASSRQQKFTHTVRSKSFARVANEEEVTSGSNIGRIKLFYVIHTKKDDSHMTPEAAEIMEKLRDKRTEYEATTSTHGSVNVDDLKNQVVDVLRPERYGRARSFRYMPSHSLISQIDFDHIKQQLKQQFDEKIAQIEAEVKAREAEREATYQKKYQDLQNQLQDIMKMIQQNQPQNPPS